MPKPMDEGEFERKRRQALRLLWFALGRLAAWVVFGIWIFVFDPPLEQSVPVLVFMSLYANAATEAGAAQAALATLRSLENPPT